MGSGGVKLVAVLMIATALGLAAYAWTKVRRGPERAPPVAVNAPAPEVRAVVALRDLAAGETLVDAALVVQPVDALPKGGYRRMAQVTGRRLTRAVAAGRPLTAADFALLSLADVLAPGELGMAVKVSPATGVGGFVKPGDRVDLLLYLREKKGEVSSTRAQVLATRLRLLCYGPSCNRFGDQGKLLEVKDGKQAKIAPDSKARTAVVAVPESQVTRLMLGISSGAVRLVLRSALEPSPAPDAAAGALPEPSPLPPVVTLRELTGRPPQAVASAPSPAPRARRPEVVAEVVRGTRVQRLSR